jgi:protein ImuB
VLVAPHWSIVAAGLAPAEPAAVVRANRIVDVSPGALDHGVVIGLRRREAQARCPGLEVLDHDPARDARQFEPLVAVLEALTPRVEILSPGRCCFPTIGPSRYFGGDQALGERAAELVDEVLGGLTHLREAGSLMASRVGIADGLFAASLAAQHFYGGEPADGSRVRVIDVLGSRDYLARFPISALGEGASPVERSDELINMFKRLGIERLGDLTVLAPEDLLGRFGRVGVLAHRLACGSDDRPPDTRPIPPDLVVSVELEPPAVRVDAVAFVAKTLADQIHTRLTRDGLACTRLVVEAETEFGEISSRYWRHENTFTPAAMSDRVRWQLDGWFHSAQRPSGGIAVLRLMPDEVVSDEGRQLGFWGGQTQADERAARGLARVQGMLGADAVTVPEVKAGRLPRHHEGRVSISGVELGPDRQLGLPWVSEAPWPGRLPVPSPARVMTEPQPIELVSGVGEKISVDGRGMLSDIPAGMARPGGRVHRVQSWAGPWPLDERWWDSQRHNRQAQLQVELDDNSAHLVAIQGGQWWLEATYD